MPTRACLLFRVHKTVFALDSASVVEVIPLPALSAIEEAPPCMVGAINLRGRVLPVMDLHLRLGRNAQPYSTGDNIIVVQCRELTLGMIANEVSDVVSYTEDQMAPQPVFGPGERPEPSLVRGMLKIGDSLALLLRHEELASAAVHVADASLARETPVAAGHHGFDQSQFAPSEAALFRERSRSLSQPVEDADSCGLSPMAVIEIGGEWFGVELKEVREFAEFRDVSPVPCCPEHIVGLTNLRGTIVTVVDIRSVLGVAGGPGADPRLVVVELDGSLVGVIADAICTVASFRPSDFTALPLSVGTAGRPYLRGAARWQEGMLTTLDLKALLTGAGLVVEMSA
jgi:purine-binding chemotaxis protein CheW